MVIAITRMVEINIQVVSPLSTVATTSGAGASWPRAGRAKARPARAASPRIFDVLNAVIAGILLRLASEGGRAGFTGADAGHGQKVEHEDLAVADATGLGAVANGGHDGVGLAVVHRDLDLELGQEVHGIFRTAVDFGMALLPAIAFDFGHGHAVDVERVQR